MLSRLSALTFFAVLMALVVAGCRRKPRDRVIVTNINGSGIFTTDDFPGAPVSAGNTADDNRAMSPSNESITGAVKVTYNGDRRSAMVSYTTVAGLSTILYSQYFDGDAWTPPVAMEANGINAGISAVDARSVIHVFLNTENHDSEEARSRNGDCLIVWAARDVSLDGGPLDAVNRCLFATYFDADLADSPADRHGFQKLARRLSVEDGATEDVLTFGVATDGLCGEARWDTLGNSYRYGDDTTSAVVFWVQSEDNDADATDNDQALHVVHFDPAELLDPEFPLTPSSDTRLPLLAFGASDAGLSSEETLVESLLTSSYNGTIFVRTAARNDTAGDDLPAFILYGGSVDNNTDEVLQAVTVNLATGSVFPPIHLHDTAILATDLVDNRSFFMTGNGALGSRAIFGSDEGLANVAIFSTQLLDSLTGSHADLTANSRLAIAEINEADGTLLDIGFLDVNDPDISDAVIPFIADVRISRNGDYVMLAWMEIVDAGLTDDIGLWAAQYVTTRRDDDGDPVVIPPLSDTLSPPVNVNADVDGQNVLHFMFQNGLGYVCGAQSNPDVMNLLFEQSGVANDQLFTVRLTADLTTAPILGSAATMIETFEEGDLSSAATVNYLGVDFNAVDGGDDGSLLVVYRQDVDLTASDDFRLFAETTGTGAAKIEIDSNTTTRQVGSQTLRLFPTPPGEDIGTFDPVSGEDDAERAHAPDFVQALFFEDAVDESDGLGDALRTRRYSTDLDEPTLGERFVPPVNADALEPFELSLPFTNPDLSFAPVFIGTGTSGNRFAVWFVESGHIYYQECNPEEDNLGWRLLEGDDDDDPSSGLSDPALVDDDSEEDISGNFIFAVRSCTCDTLGGAMVLWKKQLPTEGADLRLQVRVRDDDN